MEGQVGDGAGSIDGLQLGLGIVVGVVSIQHGQELGLVTGEGIQQSDGGIVVVTLSQHIGLGHQSFGLLGQCAGFSLLGGLDGGLLILVGLDGPADGGTDEGDQQNQGQTQNHGRQVDLLDQPFAAQLLPAADRCGGLFLLRFHHGDHGLLLFGGIGEDLLHGLDKLLVQLRLHIKCGGGLEGVLLHVLVLGGGRCLFLGHFLDHFADGCFLFFGRLDAQHGQEVLAEQIVHFAVLFHGAQIGQIAQNIKIILGSGGHVVQDLIGIKFIAFCHSITLLSWYSHDYSTTRK